MNYSLLTRKEASVNNYEVIVIDPIDYPDAVFDSREFSTQRISSVWITSSNSETASSFPTTLWHGHGVQAVVAVTGRTSAIPY